MDKPKVSIVIPCFNAGEFVRQSIQSILNQTYQNLELLICDDASTDNTREIIDNFSDSRIRRFYHTENKGYLVTCNELFNEATGRFITFQDADDISETHRISKCMDTFTQNQEIDFVSSDYRLITKAGNPMITHLQEVDFERYKSDADYTISFCGASLMIKQEVLKTIGGYHPFFGRLGGEDYEWLFRIVQKFKGKHIAEPLYIYRMYNSQAKLYNIQHVNYDSFIIHQAIEFLRKAFIQKKIYLLDNENRFWLDDKIKSLEEPFHSDPSMFYRFSALRYLKFRDFNRSIAITFQAIRKNPKAAINYVYPLYILYLIFRRKVPFQIMPKGLRK